MRGARATQDVKNFDMLTVSPDSPQCRAIQLRIHNPALAVGALLFAKFESLVHPYPDALPPPPPRRFVAFLWEI